MFVDHYLTLGVSRHATHEDIEKAYDLKSRAIPNHAKEGTYAYEKLLELNNAYNTFQFPAEKKKYDLIYDDYQQKQRQRHYGQNQSERYGETAKVLSEPFDPRWEKTPGNNSETLRSPPCIIRPSNGRRDDETFYSREEPERHLSMEYEHPSDESIRSATETSGNYEETFTDRSAGELLLLPVAIENENDEDLSSQDGETNVETAAVEQLKQMLPKLKRCRKEIDKIYDQITKIVNGQQFVEEEGWSS